MAKKQLKIPFKDGRPCKWVKDVHDEENFGIKLVKVLPKIHKISLDMIAKDIFRP